MPCRYFPKSAWRVRRRYDASGARQTASVIICGKHVRYGPFHMRLRHPHVCRAAGVRYKLQNATRICEAKHGTLFLFAEGAFQPVAAYGASAEPELTWDMLQGHAIQPTPGTGLGRMLRAKATVRSSRISCARSGATRSSFASSIWQIPGGCRLGRTR
jgi:hypothetical protein